MVVNDSGLIRAMKDAYKGTGYTVAGIANKDAPGIIIIAPLWAVVLRQEVAPRKVLALIVEHAGKLPRENTAFHVRKPSAVQDKIYDMAIQPMRVIQQMAKEGELNEIKPTRLTFGGWNIWQQPETLEVKQVHPDRQAVMSFGNGKVYLVSNSLYIEDGASAVFVVCETAKDLERPMIQHLEQMQWVTE